MELWSGVLSNNAAKVRIALAEKGLEVKVHNLEWTRANAWGEKPREFLAVSPRGQVPVLIDGDLVVYDSTVINEYLDAQYPQPPLMPTDVRGRTLCRLWEDEADYIANTAIAPLIARAFVGNEPEHPEVAQAMQEFEQWTGRLSAQLGEQDYICGAFSLADIASFLTAAFGNTLGAQIPGGNVEAWYERMLARDTVRTEYDAIMTAAAAA